VEGMLSGKKGFKRHSKKKSSGNQRAIQTGDKKNTAGSGPPTGEKGQDPGMKSSRKGQNPATEKTNANAVGRA